VDELNKATGQRQAMKNSYYNLRNSANSLKVPLPSGWSRHRRVDLVQSSNQRPIVNNFKADHQPEYLYRYRDMKENFVWPVPIPNQSLQPTSGQWSSQLYLRTTRAFLSIGDLIPLPPAETGSETGDLQYKWFSECPYVYLNDQTCMGRRSSLESVREGI